MESIIILVLIAGLLIGWFLMMREEVVGLIIRAWASIRAKPQTKPETLTDPLVVNPCPTMANSDPTASVNEMQRKSPETEGGIPTWTIG